MAPLKSSSGNPDSENSKKLNSKNLEMIKFAKRIHLFAQSDSDSTPRLDSSRLRDYQFMDADELLKTLLNLQNESDAKRLQFYIKMNAVIEEERKGKSFYIFKDFNLLFL